MSIRAVIQRQGGPEVIDFVEDETASTPPGPGEVRMRHTAIGLNLIDTYHRAGVYPLKLPSGLGMEASGVVLDCGPGVEDFAPGDRVAYAGGALRAYAHERLIEASHLVRLPPDIGDEVAAAVLLKGMTVRYLLTRTFAVRAGHVLLVHAAAGGVGSLLVPWAKHLGARVIGCARGAEKQDAARASGCDHVLDAEHPDFVRQVRDLTGGVGVDVAYDSVGRATFDASLACLRRLGMLVSYGNASGKPPAIEPTRLAAMGSLFLTRPILGDYIATRPELDATADAVFDALRRGVILADIRQRYPLLEARRAHEEMASRTLRGLSVLLP